jgi:hypothetical protein
VIGSWMVRRGGDPELSGWSLIVTTEGVTEGRQRGSERG